MKFVAVFRLEMQFSLNLYLNLNLIKILALHTAILTFPNKKNRGKTTQKQEEKAYFAERKCPGASEVREPDRLNSWCSLLLSYCDGRIGINYSVSICLVFSVTPPLLGILPYPHPLHLSACLNGSIHAAGNLCI